MVFRRVHDRVSSAYEAESAASEWAAAAVAGLESLFGPYLKPGEAVPDVAFLQELVGRVLADHRSVLKENGMRQELSERGLAFLRIRRDEAAENLRDALRSARFYFDGLRGRGYGKKLGLGHGLSRLPPMFLARLGIETADNLATEPPAAKAKQGGLQDPHQLAGFVRGHAERLVALLAELAPERAGRKHRLGEKRRSLVKTEDVIRRCTAFLGGLYRLGGLPDLAERVRPKLRRPKKRRKPAKAEPPVAAMHAPLPEASILEGLDLSTISVAEDRGAGRRTDATRGPLPALPGAPPLIRAELDLSIVSCGRPLLFRHEAGTWQGSDSVQSGSATHNTLIWRMTHNRRK